MSRAAEHVSSAPRAERERRDPNRMVTRAEESPLRLVQGLAERILLPVHDVVQAVFADLEAADRNCQCIVEAVQCFAYLVWYSSSSIGGRRLTCSHVMRLPTVSSSSVRVKGFRNNRPVRRSDGAPAPILGSPVMRSTARSERISRAL
jgi:hypothetical protein